MLKREVQLEGYRCPSRSPAPRGVTSFGQATQSSQRCHGLCGKVGYWGQRAEAFHVTRFSTVEGGSMHVHFVSTDYSNLILYVRFEDNEVTNLWALLGR